MAQKGKCERDGKSVTTIPPKKCHIIHFFAVTKSDCKFTQFTFCNKIYEAFLLAFYLMLRQNGYTYLSRDLYYIL
jgi:hypothetical protein